MFLTKPKLRVLRGGEEKKSLSGFPISQLVWEILMQGEIYAWSVIKSAYTESDGFH